MHEIDCDLDSHPKIQTIHEKFDNQMNEYIESLNYCPHCKERFFEKKLVRLPDRSGSCATCASTSKPPSENGKGKGKGVRLFSKDNDMDPFERFPDDQNVRFDGTAYSVLDAGYPHHLPKLNAIEEMSIALVNVIMKSYRLANGTMAYKGQILNIEQDIQSLATLLEKLENNEE